MDADELLLALIFGGIPLGVAAIGCFLALTAVRRSPNPLQILATIFVLLCSVGAGVSLKQMFFDKAYPIPHPYFMIAGALIVGVVQRLSVRGRPRS